MAKAYSYIRMSTQRQLAGDSLRRQLDKSERYAREKGLELDDSLSFRDIGLSAYDGSNLEKGGLGTFLQAVKAGKIDQGSYLLVESFDRLSRQRLRQQLRLFLDLLDSGINVVTLTDGRTYTPDADHADLTMSLGIMARAYDESVTKSERVAAAWQNNRERARERILTKRCVAWLTPRSDRTGFEPIPERVALVQRIFSEAADGGMGADVIARRLNREGVPPFGRSTGWQKSYIQKILSNRAVIGEFHPHTKRGGKRTPTDQPIAGYYPAIVEEELFYRAQAARDARRQSGSGRKGSRFTNLFSGLLRCGTCNGRMHVVNKGRKDGRVLLCDSARRDVTDCYRGGWNLEDFETSFLTFISEIDLATIDGQLRPDSEQSKLRDDIREIEGRLVEAKTRRDRAYGAVLESEASNFLKEKLRESDAAVIRLESDLEERRQLQASIIQTAVAFEEGKAGVQDLINKLQAQQGEEAVAFRFAVAFHLRSIIERIAIFPGGTQSKPDVEQAMREMYPDREWPEIDPYLSKYSKRDRAFYVVFKNGSFRMVGPDADDPREVRMLAATGEPLQTFTHSRDLETMRLLEKWAASVADTGDANG